MQRFYAQILHFVSLLAAVALVVVSIVDVARGDYLFLTFALFFVGVILAEAFQLLPFKFLADPRRRDIVVGFMSGVSLLILDFGLALMPFFLWQNGVGDVFGIAIYGASTLAYLSLSLYAGAQKEGFGTCMANHYLCAFAYAAMATAVTALYCVKAPFDSPAVYVPLLAVDAILLIGLPLKTFFTLHRARKDNNAEGENQP